MSTLAQQLEWFRRGVEDHRELISHHPEPDPDLFTHIPYDDPLAIERWMEGFYAGFSAELETLIREQEEDENG